ncbi:adenylate/guanylate cyclase domain-containing protein [Roseovarius indicus]|uniref:adenylate/guanylate cyclase domain-containing protein n=1 Tax=Roseovarius indicus TaxID=540747 RepID=UPI0009ECC6CF|nr:adenylate/guanylate cyclase domain-containing protein [Roseovarius indicus]
MNDLKDEIDNEVSEILSSDFTVNVTETRTVPKANDPAITFPNLRTGQLSCKLIETCVLYIDIRKSTELNLKHRRATVAKLYSAFGRAMTKCARHFGGHVRGIIGDRLMVVFDSENCFRNALDTAVLMNSVCKYVLNKKFPHNDIKCGIGIDYGRMLITKVGIIRRSVETSNYQGLVWLGRPANLASKLTDLANKSGESFELKHVSTGFQVPGQGNWRWTDQTLEDFVNCLDTLPFSNDISHRDPNFRSFIKTSTTIETRKSTPPILMTKEVWKGFSHECPSRDCVTKRWYRKNDVQLPEYSGEVFGGDVIFTVFRG